MIIFRDVLLGTAEHFARNTNNNCDAFKRVVLGYQKFRFKVCNILEDGQFGCICLVMTYTG